MTGMTERMWTRVPSRARSLDFRHNRVNLDWLFRAMRNREIDPTYPLSRLAMLAAMVRAGALDAAGYVALYVLHWQVARYGRGVAQRRSRRDPPADGVEWLSTAIASPARSEFLADLFARYELRGVRRRVGVTLQRWLCGDWRPTLLHAVPAPRTVLRMQAAGSRPVTVIGAYPRLLRPVLDKADAFAFVCHDLEHAWQFFHDPARREAQQRFARRLEHAWTAGAFDACLADPAFADKFEHLAADMNTHVLHSLQYLRAILIEHHLRRAGLDPRARLPAAARAAVRAALAALIGDAETGAVACDALGDGTLNVRDAATLEAALCA